ncbi:MAG: endolytic transglycosylase MltG [Candidatus Aminicenantes bacterium]|nr:endolytic transglycosylase MltG [Candidatus Aminicenantes bacterium]
MRTFLKIAKSALIGVQVLVLGGWIWFYLESGTVPGAGSGTVLFEVEKGKGVRAIAEALTAAKILSKRTPFVLGYDLFFAPRSIKAGEYQLPSTGPAGAVLDILINGRVYLHPVTVPEGLTGPEIFAIFSAAGFGGSEEFEAAFGVTDDIALWDPQAADVEGYLFPETYHLPKSISAKDILQTMIGQFKEVFGENGRRRAAELHMTVREVVILASLIEKETARPDEKRLVSAVFHNRLRLGMKLDCDPTIIYALKLEGPFEGRLRTKDLKYDSPYNTYLHPGLPPGPIANPGRASLEAALRPAEAEYLYFVARNDGSHQFSRTLAEHRLAVKKYRN